MTETYNPIASTTFTVTDVTDSQVRPSGTVVAKQAPSHTDADFLRDLGTATQRKPKSETF